MQNRGKRKRSYRRRVKMCMGKEEEEEEERIGKWVIKKPKKTQTKNKTNHKQPFLFSFFSLFFFLFFFLSSSFFFHFVLPQQQKKAFQCTAAQKNKKQRRKKTKSPPKKRTQRQSVWGLRGFDRRVRLKDLAGLVPGAGGEILIELCLVLTPPDEESGTHRNFHSKESKVERGLVRCEQTKKKNRLLQYKEEREYIQDGGNPKWKQLTEGLEGNPGKLFELV